MDGRGLPFRIYHKRHSVPHTEAFAESQDSARFHISHSVTVTVARMLGVRDLETKSVAAYTNAFAVLEIYSLVWKT